MTLNVEDLRGPGATLGAGVSGGFVAGVLIGGVGGRLAMLALRLTSDPLLRGVPTDDGFTIGRVSAETLFLLGVTAGLGMAGGLFYLVVRRWIPPAWRIALMTVFFALVGGAGVIGPSDVDFTLLSPLSLAVALFVTIPAGVRGGDAVDGRAPAARGLDPATRALGVDAGLAPLVFANVVGVAILLLAFGLWALGRSAPNSSTWRSQVAAWLGRAALVAMALASGAGFLRDGIDILG